jgi:hypothetical protein
MWLFSRQSEPKAVSAYWSALVRGAPSDEVARLAKPLSPELLTMIAQIRSERPDPLPDPAFVVRLESNLMNALASLQTGVAVLRPLEITPSNGRAEPSRWR